MRDGKSWPTWLDIDGLPASVIHVFSAMSESANTEIVQSKAVLPKRKPDYALLARMVIREGKQFKESALAAGYAASIAGRGLKALVAESAPLAEAIQAETKSFISLDKLKPLAVQRLHAEITNPRSSLGIKAIELAGRFKETDWFVKSGGEVNIGVFGALSELGPTIDASAAALPADENEP